MKKQVSPIGQDSVRLREMDRTPTSAQLPTLHRTALAAALLSVSATQYSNATTSADLTITPNPNQTAAQASSSAVTSTSTSTSPTSVSISDNTNSNQSKASHLATQGTPQTRQQTLPSLTVLASSPASYGASTSPNTTKTDIALKDYPASIQVVTTDTLQDRGVTSIDQALDNVSGVHAEASYGGNGATFFNIRGFSESNGLRDGFRNYGYYAFRDVQDIDRIDVYKGPAGALYGGVGAVGGYINTVSKRPERDDFGEVSVTGGSYGLTRSTLDLNRAVSDNVSIRLNAAAESNSTFRDNGAYHSWSVAPAVTWDNHNGTSLTLLTEFNHLDRDGFDFGVPATPNYRDLSRTRYYGLSAGDYPGVSGDFGRNDTQSETLIFEHALSDNWKLRLAGQYTYARQYSTQSFPDSTTATNDLVEYSTYKGTTETSRQYAGQAELTGDFFTGRVKHTVLAGLEYGYLKLGNSGSDVSTFTLNLTDPEYLSGLIPSGSLAAHQAEGKDYGAYVQDTMDLTKQIKLMAGLRMDRFLNRSEQSGEGAATGQQTAFSPRIGLVWQPIDTTSLFTCQRRLKTDPLSSESSE